MKEAHRLATRLLLLARSGAALCLAALATAPDRRRDTAGSSPGDGLTTFPTAEAAAQALVNAAAADDTAAFELLFGPSARRTRTAGPHSRLA